METKSVYQAMRTFFEEDDWSFTPMDDQPVLRMAFKGESEAFNCFAQALEERDQFTFYSVAPFTVPLPQRPEAIEFVTRANYGMFVGNFEMDVRDGEVRYKTSADVADTDMPAMLFKTNVVQNVLTMDRYLAALKAVAEGELTAAEAIEQVEG